MEKIYQNYAHLDFPFNVYAHCLYLQEGKVDYLHYGLFHPGESLEKIQTAQQRSTELLLARLPKPPCRILEIGIGLGTTASVLAEHGYTVTSISSNAEQIALAKQHVQEDVTLQCVTYEAFSAPAESYDVILLQESAQSIQSLVLFNKAHHLLAEHGFILIIDEVALQRTAKDSFGVLPMLTYTLAQAQRCGFELKEQIDLSTPAAPTVDYLLWVIEKHQAKLLADLDLKPVALNELLASLRESQQKYRDGHYGYVLLNLAKTSQPRWKITPVTAQDKKAVIELFSEVFHPEQMSEAFWDWKYGQRGLGIAAWQNGKMVAHYGGIMREIRYFGQPKLAVQNTDVMVLTKERGILKRQGAFFLTTATFLESYMGYGAQTWLGYGFPSYRHVKLAQLLGLYAPVGKMIELRWQTITGKPHFWTRIRHLQPQSQIEKSFIINKLWQKMQSCLQQALVAVRDWDYVQHRYLLHPHHKYELLLVSRRFTGQPLGVAVIYRQEQTCHIRDLIGHVKHIPEVLQQVRRIAGHWGMNQVSLWITENFATVFPLQDVERQDLEIYVPHNIWSQSFPPEETNGRWWLMSGDTDFL